MAYDPGGTTGWAYCEYLNHTHPLNEYKFTYYQGQIGPDEHHDKLYEHLNMWAFGVEGPPLIVVCESFEFRQHINQAHTKTKVELISKEYIGVIKLFCMLENLNDPVFQTATTAKTFIPDKGPQAHVKIKQLGLWVPGKVHAMDATRHLLRYMVVNKRIRSPITDAWL